MEGVQHIALLSPTYRSRTSSDKSEKKVRARRDFVCQHPLVPRSYSAPEKDLEVIRQDAEKAGHGPVGTTQTIRTDLAINRRLLEWWTRADRREELTRRVTEGKLDPALTGIRCVLEDVRKGEHTWGEYHLTPQEIQDVRKWADALAAPEKQGAAPAGSDEAPRRSNPVRQTPTARQLQRPALPETRVALPPS